jgi:hypothetical protein
MVTAASRAHQVGELLGVRHGLADQRGDDVGSRQPAKGSPDPQPLRDVTGDIG